MKTFILISFIISVVICVNGQQLNVTINDGFAHKPFKTNPSPDNISSILKDPFSIEKKPTKNKHSEAIDTLLIYNSKNNEVVLLKTTDKVLFVKAIITDCNVVLESGIKIGLSKTEFIKKLKINKDLWDNNPLIIVDSSEYFYHTFYFKNNMLFKIVLDSSPD
ncbi:MAG: hypothetical protein HRU69_07330 [Flammeovirgaceae bacterium]|nr:MAG: hypothetical protein HRU69_07330 [Flammeovirgaceae bacterium]